MMNKNVFLKRDSDLVDSISKKVTYTSILETVPDDSTETELKDWKKLGKTEWRWRFLELDGGRSSVEISFLTSNKHKPRMYFNDSGDWVERDVSPMYDKYVVKTLYYYS